MSSKTEILGFEDSWKKNRHVFESAKSLAKVMYLDGQQSKQVEVDELQRKLDTEKSLRSMSEHLNNTKQSEVNELQKRIDIALDHAVNHGGYDDLTHIINILNGDQS